LTSEQGKIHSTSVKGDRAETAMIARLETPGSSDIVSLIEPYRRELQLHCYRLLGSLHDAEDVVQETMLRAWQRFDTFKGASSLRTWLYTIATNASLDALKKRPPRTLPQSSYPALDPLSPIAPPIREPIWLEPFPDSWLIEADNPEARYTQRESVSLAFLAALQLLPPRQRAILLLSDVLDWHASEVAQLLETSVSAVKSGLHRARTTLASHYDADRQEMAQGRLLDAATSTLLARYVQAWETDDVAGLVALLKEDATFSMPPFAAWYGGREAIGAIFTSKLFGSGVQKKWRLSPTGANAQPAFAVYRADEAQGCYRAFGIQVVTLAGAAPTRHIAAITLFNAPSLLTSFGFPLQWPE
jgi:RNA polymerase sigma-70 factor (ECF subfamily)